jgi:hypothetical protein
MAGSGWKGIDPVLRALRALAVVAFLGLLAALILNTDRQPDLTLAFLLIGATIFALGYDVALRIPGFLERKPEDDDDDD